jgi:hypothetical protein
LRSIKVRRKSRGGGDVAAGKHAVTTLDEAHGVLYAQAFAVIVVKPRHAGNLSAVSGQRLASCSLPTTGPVAQWEDFPFADPYSRAVVDRDREAALPGRRPPTL